MHILRSMVPFMNRPAARFGQPRRVSRSMPIEYFILTSPRFEGAVIAVVAGEPICEHVVDGNGLRYRYVGLAPRDSDGRFDVDSLRAGEWIVQPGLVYAMDVEDAPDLQG